MSTVIVVAPLIIAGWPVITSAVAAAVGAMGFSIVSARAEPRISEEEEKTREVIDVEDSEILAESAAQEIVVERDGVRAVFSRDARGALKLCMEGHGHSKGDLRRIGEELLGRVTQQYAYHRIVSELKEHGMCVVDEQVSADRTVKIRVRVN
jgi:hypothetical protein